MARDLLKEIGAERLPTHVKTKRVTELMELSGRKAIVTGAGGPGLGQACAHRLGGLDILVNNVGGGPAGPFARQSKDEIDLAVSMTLTGTLYCTRGVLDVMIPQRSGRIINVSSEGGRIGMKNLVVYNACKSAVIGFTRNLAHEVAEHGIYVLGVCPGIMLHETLKEILRHPLSTRMPITRRAPR